MSQAALPAPAGPRDRAGDSFQVLASLGEQVGIAFGRVSAGDAVEWFELPHTDFDGVGGLAHLLRGRGMACAALPGLARPERPGFLGWLRILRQDPSGDRHPVVAWRRFDPALRPGGETNRPAWRLLSLEESAAIGPRAEASGASLNTWLLLALHRALVPRLVEGTPARPGLWMVPVNMRGGVKAARDTANQSGYLAVELPAGAGPSEAHAAVKDALARNLHWAAWLQAGFSRFVGRGLYGRLIRGYWSRPRHPWLGAFSNLGEWPPQGEAGEPGTSGWVFTPPVMKTIPLAAGAISWRGRLGLALRLHPALCAAPGDAEAWLKAWIEEIGRS